jgi:hypothetical protein
MIERLTSQVKERRSLGTETQTFLTEYRGLPQNWATEDKVNYQTWSVTVHSGWKGEVAMTTLQKFKVWGNKPIAATCCISDSEQAQAGQYSDNIMDLLNRELNPIFFTPGVSSTRAGSKSWSIPAVPFYLSIFVVYHLCNECHLLTAPYAY